MKINSNDINKKILTRKIHKYIFYYNNADTIGMKSIYALLFFELHTHIHTYLNIFRSYLKILDNAFGINNE